MKCWNLLTFVWTFEALDPVCLKSPGPTNLADPSWGMHWIECSWRWNQRAGTCSPARMIQCFWHLPFLLGLFNKLRTSQQADHIHTHGMMFLRAHRLLTRLAQRLGAWWMKRSRNPWFLNLGETLFAGTTCSFGCPSQRSTWLGFKSCFECYWIENPQTQHASEMVHHQLLDCKRRRTWANTH